MQMEKACSAEDLLQMCLAALESEGEEAGVRERLGLPKQDGGPNGKKKDASTVQKALLQVHLQWLNLPGTTAIQQWCQLQERACHHCAEGPAPGAFTMVASFRHHCNLRAVSMARKGMAALCRRPCARCGLSLESVATSLHLR